MRWDPQLNFRSLSHWERWGSTFRRLNQEKQSHVKSWEMFVELMETCLWRDLLTLDFRTDCEAKPQRRRSWHSHWHDHWNFGSKAWLQPCQLHSSRWHDLCTHHLDLPTRRDVTTTQHYVCHSHYLMTSLKAWTNNPLAGYAAPVMTEKPTEAHGEVEIIWPQYQVKPQQWMKEGQKLYSLSLPHYRQHFPPPPIMKSEVQKKCLHNALKM